MYQNVCLSVDIGKNDESLTTNFGGLSKVVHLTGLGVISAVERRGLGPEDYKCRDPYWLHLTRALHMAHQSSPEVSFKC